MSSYDLHRAINVVKNTISYDKLLNALILGFLNNGYEVRAKTNNTLTVESTEKIAGDALTVCMDTLDLIINEYHDEIESALEEISIARGFLDREVLGSTGSICFIIPIPDSNSCQIII